MNRPGRTAAAIASVAVAALGVGLAVWLRPPAPFAFRWPAGSIYTYEVALDVNGSVAAGADALAAALAVDGDLELRSYGRLGEQGDWVLGARLARTRRLDWTLGKLPLLADRGAALVGPEVELVVAPDGTFRNLAAAPDAPPALLNLLRQVLAPLEVIVASGERAWTRVQKNQVGDVRVSYVARASRSGTLALSRRPQRYIRLAAGPVVGVEGADPGGAFEAVLDREGHLDRIDGWEDISVTGPRGGQEFRQQLRIAARLVSMTQARETMPAAARVAGLVPSKIDDVSASADAGQQMLEARAGGLTMETLVQQLFTHGGASTFPGVSDWMWRGTGLLRLHPELCLDLIEVFRSEKLNERGRARLLDLLASTGTPEAQAVIRELLETPEARAAQTHALFLQRLSLVDAPTAETVEYLRAKVERGEGDETMAAAHALGAAIGRLERDGKPDGRSEALLRQGLASARSGREKADWLGAIGNAGLERDTPLIAGYAADRDPVVRGAAAEALRKTQTPATEQILLGLAVDVDPSVRDRALHTLSGYRLAPEILAALGQQVAAGRLPPSSFGSLVLLLESQRGEPQAVLPVLDAMLAHEVSTPRLLLRIRALKAALSRGS